MTTDTLERALADVAALGWRLNHLAETDQGRWFASLRRGREVGFAWGQTAVGAVRGAALDPVEVKRG